MFNRNGTVDYKPDAFNKTLAHDPVAVQKFLIGDGFKTGFVNTLRKAVGSLLDSGFGEVAIRQQGLRDRINQMDKDIADKERELAVKEKTIREKFARLSDTMARLKSQGGALAGMVNSGGGNGGGGGGGLGGMSMS